MIVLMPHCGFLSETTRMLAIARALRARGEPALLATHGGPYTRVLDDAGEPWVRLAPAMDGDRCQRFLQDLARIGQPNVRMQPVDEVRASVQAEAELLRRVGARAVCSGFTLTAHLSSRVAGVPLVTSHGGSFVPPVFERGLAPVPSQMAIPGTEWLPDWLKKRMANASVARMTWPTRFLNEVAAELGVEPVPTLAALMLGDLTLVTDVPEVLGVPRAELEAWRPRTSPAAAAYRPDTQLVYSGPLFARLPLPLPVPPDVERFLQGPRPVALVVLSSASPRLLRTVTNQVRAAGVRVIVGATIHDYGPNDDPDVVVAGLLPNHELMPQVDLAVNMGGQGTVQTAMHSATPLVGIPLHPEQELNVDLAARQGMAIAVAPRQAGTSRLTEAVRRVRDEPSFKAAARRVAALYAGIDGAAEAADAILGHLDANASPARAAA